MDGRRVTVGMDGSVAAFRALDAATTEAGLRGARLDVVCCVPDPDEAGPVLRSAAARVKERHPELPLTMTAVVGDPVDALAERSRTSELVVVGCRGRARVSGLPLHSVSRRLASRTRGPLLVVRGHDGRAVDVRGPAPAASGAVLLGVESDKDTDAALFAFQEAGLRRAPLRVLHAWTYRQRLLGEAADEEATEEPLREGIGRHGRAASALPEQPIAPPQSAAPARTAQATAVRVLACRALVEATGGAGLIVIAARPGHTWMGRQIGPVTDALLRHSLCPVAVVPVPAG